MAEVLTFDSFRPGASMGRTSETIGAQVMELWQRLYPGDAAPAGELPAGLANVLLMRAYMRILTPRPPGNIHVRQRLALLAGIAPGEEVTTELECAGKELKRERRYVELACRASGNAGRPLFDGRMTVIWAA